ncbi:MAG: hypothetical protein IKQ58_02265 [Prevotella sp.]|nr:hypothetical protein [Prevotella sp.]
MKTKLYYSIPLRNGSGKVALPEFRMNLSSASYPRMLLFLMSIAMMVLAPSAMNGATTTIDLETPGTVAYNAANGTANYEINVQMGANYSGITNAKVGNKVDYRNKSTSWKTTDISRLAFNYNYNGAGNADSDVDGFYFRRDARDGVKQSGLYNHKWFQEFAVLNLKPGDAVTFTYGGGAECDNNANLRIVREIDPNGSGGWLTQVGKGQTTSYTYNVGFLGDLVVRANAGTFLKKIEIVSNPAQYEIVTNGNATTFRFTASGSLEENDYAIPFLSASFGSINDYLVVQNLEAHMYNSEGNEDLKTQGVNFQPSAGSFYAFKPTSSGTISVKGSLQGDKIHVFVYNPAIGTVGDWDEKVQGNFYRNTFTSGEFSFSVVKDKIYYICQDNNNESGNAFHLSEFTFTHSFKVEQLAKIVNLETDVVNGWIQLTKIEGAGMYNIHTKRCSGNITPPASQDYKIQNNYLYMKAPTFAEGTDNGGTVIIDVKTQGGDVAFVATFPYHADYGYDETIGRSQGHIWNFIDPRNSDSNFGNCWIRNGDFEEFNRGTVSGILSIGQCKDTNSQFYHETQNREWTYSQRQTGTAGGFHDPYYANVFDMEGDNADMIWETEGLWFDTGTNLSCIYNEKNALAWNNDPLEQKGNPVNFKTLQLVDDSGNPKTTTDKNGNVIEFNEDPDRYVGLMPVTDGKKSSFTIPGLKPGDRVLIFMKSGEATGTNGIFLNITGAKDALGKAINPSDLYKAGGTNWQHNRYEGCYHFIKDETTDPGSDYGRMTFSMNSGSMCKLLYIRIYTGQRIVTTNIVSSATGDAGRLLFMNDKGAALGSDGQGSQFSLRFRGKGQHSTNQVLTYSGNLNAASFTGDNFKVTGAYNHLIDFKSKVGEIGMFRLRMNDITYEYEKSSDQKITYVADFCDRNFTVGYRDKVDSYPYTWDFTDIQGFSSDKMSAEASNYPIDAASQDAYGHEWDISLFDANGNMKVNTGFDPITNNLIFSPHKIGFGNQLWAGGNVIPETRGLWFYSEDDSESGYTSDYSSALYNDCLQITSEGIRFANVPDDEGKRVAWWNYKMVVPDVPTNGAVYLRMKRDESVPDNAKTYSTIDGADVPFVATRFKFASQLAKTEVFTTNPVTNNAGYAFYEVDGADDEWILSVKNTTGNKEHLTFTLNGWIVKKVAVSTDSKKVNVKGWTTESRGRVIDPALTAFMTGRDMRTYIVTDVEYSKTKKQATLTRIDTDRSDNPKFKDGCLMPVANDGDENACIILNCTSDGENGIAGEEAKLLDGGFHLFVPDMHDYNPAQNANHDNDMKKSWTTYGVESLMKSQVSPTNGKTIPAEEGGYTNYAFTCKYYDIDPATGDIINDPKVLKEGIQAFYRIVGAASSTGNQGYLPIKIVEESNSGNNENNEGGETNPSRAASPARVSASSPERFTIVFNNLSDVCLKDGDVNGDGLFNKLDVNTMADRLAGRPTAKFFTGVADMNNDGKIDIVDMTLMIKNITSE